MLPQYHWSRYKTPSLCRSAGRLWPAAIGCLYHVWIRPCSVWIWWGEQVKWRWVQLHGYQRSFFFWKEVKKTEFLASSDLYCLKIQEGKDSDWNLNVMYLWCGCSEVTASIIPRTDDSVINAANDDVLRSTKLNFTVASTQDNKRQIVTDNRQALNT